MDLKNKDSSDKNHVIHVDSIANTLIASIPKSVIDNNNKRVINNNLNQTVISNRGVINNNSNDISFKNVDIGTTYNLPPQKQQPSQMNLPPQQAFRLLIDPKVLFDTLANISNRLGISEKSLYIFCINGTNSKNNLRSLKTILSWGVYSLTNIATADARDSLFKQGMHVDKYDNKLRLFVGNVDE